MKIEIVAIKSEFFELCLFDREILQNKLQARPHLVIIRLKYKNLKNIEFALPIRSNISSTTNPIEYMKLPPNKSTKVGNHHGIQFSKMFPVAVSYKIKLHNDNNIFFLNIIEPFIKKNFKEIVILAQDYLIKYEEGYKPNFSTDIEKIYFTLKENNKL